MTQNTALEAAQLVAGSVAEAAIRAMLSAGIPPLTAASAFLTHGAALLNLAGHERAALEIIAHLTIAEVVADE